ncbi:MAG TPA: 16S rRNA (cytosine(967)-C(5))-methyltransferase RsmB [bacterium]|nr:16S rRNA (cytosine(967)-C(5))-methyltransferase RsmB [bacterium]
MSSQASVRSTAVEILNLISDNYTDFEKKIHTFAEKRGFSKRDQNFLYKLVNGVIIYKDLLDFIIDLGYKRSINRLEKTALNLLRVGTYQKVILDTPDHAFIYETVEAARKLRRQNLTGLVNGVLRNLPDKNDWHEELNKLPEFKKMAIEYSHPLWMVKDWIGKFGQKDTQKLLEFNNSYTRIYFRHNPIKISLEELQKKLQDNYERVEFFKLGAINLFSVKSPGKILNSPIIKDGEASVQDLSQVFSVLLLDPQKNENILDACAAPGGKTGLIAQLTQNKANLIALDKQSDRIDTLQKNIELLGVELDSVKIGDASQFEAGKFDKILLDVPCSSTGVIARRADLRWNRRPDDIKKYVQDQLAMLTNMAGQINKSGSIVYSTCSLEEEENWQVVDQFLTNHEFHVEDASNYVDEKYCDKKGAVNIKPFNHDLTGSFAVRLKKD